MADNSALGPLPNGWECRNDPRTRRNYFINYNNKTTTWDDPRVNAPPPYQEPADIIAFQDMSNFRPSPVPGRAHTAPIMGSYAIGHHTNSKIQETSFSHPMATEQSVAKLSAMFPTVSETHIRSLLIKYHSREAVVISALQVEKNPITTPGPFSTPPIARHIIVPPPLLPPNYHSTPISGLRDFTSTPPPSLYSSHGYGTGVGTLTGSPASSSCMGSPAIRHSPRPHSSPKMKLRYMKSMFPKADETIILDTLYNVDNNVQAATTQLQSMGFDKRDSTLSRAGTPSSIVREIEKVTINDKLKEKGNSTPISSARLKGVEEKQGMRDKLKKIYPDLAEQLIMMALDSVDYDESRASHILNLMIKEESTPKSTHTHSACSSQRPDSSKSEDMEGSSLGTKTTVEAEVMAENNKKSYSNADASNTKQVLKCVDELVSSIEGTIVELVPTVNVTGASTVQNSKTVSTKSTTQIPPTRISTRKAKGKKDVPKISRGTSTTEDKEYRSPYRLTPAGPNIALHHGPNDDLLIEDYVSWSGPHSRAERHIGLAKGPNKSLLSVQRLGARGPNREVCKGSQKGLAKGSIYSHLAATSTVSATVVGGSRGK